MPSHRAFEVHLLWFSFKENNKILVFSKSTHSTKHHLFLERLRHTLADQSTPQKNRKSDQPSLWSAHHSAARPTNRTLPWFGSPRLCDLPATHSSARWCLSRNSERTPQSDSWSWWWWQSWGRGGRGERRIWVASLGLCQDSGSTWRWQKSLPAGHPPQVLEADFLTTHSTGLEKQKHAGSWCHNYTQLLHMPDVFVMSQTW